MPNTIMEITLESHRDYMKRMFCGMTIRDAERHEGFISALYATEAFLVERTLRQKKNETAKVPLKPYNNFSIAITPLAVNS
jgi:hypothetical protein